MVVFSNSRFACTTLLVTLLAAACDAPASQAPIVVNCKLDPGNIHCGDVVAEVVDEPDGQGTVETGPEVSNPDTSATDTSRDTTDATGATDTRVGDTNDDVDTTPADTTPVDTSPPPCTSGATRCSDSDHVEGCVGGTWTAPTFCDNGCVAGDCKAPSEGGDCWSVFQCVRDTCFDANNQRDESCVAACEAEGDAHARAEFVAVDDCRVGCGYDQWCIVSQCMVQHAECFWEGAGNDSCSEVDICLGSCDSQADPVACQDACYQAGTATAQADHLRVIECLSYICAGMSASCWREQVQPFTACADPYVQCFGGPP